MNEPTSDEAPVKVTEKASTSLPKADVVIIGFVAAALIASFWPLMIKLNGLWFGPDTYYAHGAVVPICAGLIVWDRWPKLKTINASGVWWLAAPLLFLGWVQFVAAGNSTRMLMSVLLLAVLLVGTAFVFGWKAMRITSPAVLYLAFGLPFWDGLIDRYTQPLQGISTSIAYRMLVLLGQHPYRQDTTLIQLDRFTLDIGVPCSGLKLVLAVAAIVTFFICVAHLRWYKNIILAVIALPLSFLVNGLRICMIGIVGNQFGPDAGHTFHDYSGYISLAVCFVVLMQITKWLGWKS